MNKITKRWIIGICIGLCIPAIFFIYTNYIQHKEDSRLAKALGEDTESLVKAKALHEKAVHDHTLSDAEMLDAKHLIVHKNRDIRMRTMMALQSCSDPKVRPQALQLLHLCVEDKEPGIRSKLLQVLTHQNDPDLPTIAAKLVQDTDPEVHDAAKAALSSASPSPK